MLIYLLLFSTSVQLKNSFTKNNNILSTIIYYPLLTSWKCFKLSLHWLYVKSVEIYYNIYVKIKYCLFFFVYKTILLEKYVVKKLHFNIILTQQTNEYHV